MQPLNPTRPRLCRYDLMVLLTLALALFATVLNSYHLSPGFDLYHNLIVALVLTLGLTAAFLLRSKALLIPYSAVTWLLLFVLILIQPYINSILHPDYLVFPLGTLTLTIAVSIAIASLEDKKAFLNKYLLVFVGVMLLTVVIQFLQLRGYKLSYYDFVIFTHSERFDGNIAQPNQTAFMLALAELACLYFYYQYKNKLWLLCSTLFIIGMALTTSRGGLILGMAVIVLFNAFYNETLRNRVTNTALQLIGFAAVYFAGIFIHKNFAVSIGQVSNTQNAVERLSEGSVIGRVAFQEQALLMFQKHPLTGYGWGSFAKGSIEYATELSKFVFSKHSHVFVTQIASELGILGLLCLVPLTLYILKKINFKMDGFQALCVTAVLIIVLYSLSEFPLWYLRYLIIFAIFVSLIETKFLTVGTKYAKLLAAMTLGCAILVSIYISSFLKIYNTIGYLATHELESDEILAVYSDIPDVFGMSLFKENILFFYIPIDKEQIEGKLSLAERATATELTQRNLFRYGRLLALNNEQEKSISMFKAACALKWRGNCDNVLTELDLLVEQNPQTYEQIKDEIEQWVVNFDPRNRQ
ncbi:O-antigen ligase family protein [Psychrobacter celer]|uniref:O-antigen ligase family protein n=1 Tax=Psychrobacter celer TaxID=306572 RepID=UPI003FD55A22